MERKHLLLTISLLVVLCGIAFSQSIADYAMAGDKPEGAWVYSERPVRIFSPRESFYDPSQMIDEAGKFHGTSIRWVYFSVRSAKDKEYVNKNNGYARFGDKIRKAGFVLGGTANSGHGETQPGRDRDYLGEELITCDVTSKEYREYTVRDIQRYMDAGCGQIHFDDPSRTYSSVVRMTGGGFSESAIGKFNQYLDKHIAPGLLLSWGISPDDVRSGKFDFMIFVRKIGDPQRVKAKYPELWQQFVDFHAKELESFYNYEKVKAQEYVDSKGYGFRVVFSCNNGSLNKLDGIPYGFEVWDYFQGETSANYTVQTVQHHYNTIRGAREMGKAQYFLASNDWYCVSEQWSPDCGRVPYLFSNQSIVSSFLKYMTELEKAGDDPAKQFAARKTIEQRIPRSLVNSILSHSDWEEMIGEGVPIDPVGRKLYVERSRRAIGLCYATGSAFFAPYDRWIRGYDGLQHGVRFFGRYDEFGDFYAFIEENAALYDDHEEVFVTGDQLEMEYRARGVPASLRPVVLAGGSGDLFAAVRAIARDESSIVVHLVDWKADFENGSEENHYGRMPFSVRLQNVAFGQRPDRPMEMYLLRPGEEPMRLDGVISPGGYTSYDIPTLNPYGVLSQNLP